MASTPTLNKLTAFGFQLQDAEGIEKNNAVLWVPFNDTLDFKLRTNMEPYRQSDYNDYLHLIYSTGQWFEGGLPISLIPDAAVLTPLFQWITKEGSYNQGLFASCYIYDTARTIRAAMDVKVREATFRFEKGGVVRLDLQCVGKKPGTGTPTISYAAGRRTGPFLWRETQVYLNTGGASLTENVDIEGAEVRIDRLLEDAAAGLRITGTNGQYPQKLYNLGGINCTGSFSRDFLNSAVYDTYLAQANDIFGTTYDAQVRFVMTRGGVTATLTVNRLQFTDHTADPNGSNEGRIVEDVQWQGLGSDDGATAPVTLA